MKGPLYNQLSIYNLVFFLQYSGTSVAWGEFAKTVYFIHRGVLGVTWDSRKPQNLSPYRLD
jgi:hypothetical protein